MLTPILQHYGLATSHTVTPIYSGLINATWKIETAENSYILQRINHNVFKDPMKIAQNLDMLSEHASRSADFVLVAPLKTIDGLSCLEVQGHYYRLFPYIKGSHSITEVQNAEAAYEASKQFGKFSRAFSGFDARKLHITLPGFHDLTNRYLQLQTALQKADEKRLAKCKEMVKRLERFRYITDDFENIRNARNFPQRVVHHDTKISNVLFDESGKGICVIDLDTVMPGYYISDVGDMLRTYLSPANEETVDFENIIVRDDVFTAIVNGYLEEMSDILMDEELKYFVYAGLFLTFMQCIRFLTDYLNGDIYYPTHRPDHNLDRALNQLVLLERIKEKEKALETIVVRVKRS